ncbi:MAG: dihydroxy-acid dehydratase [Pirellulaceae bacterium]
MPSVEDWHDVNKRVARFVDVLPNGPVGHPTVRLFLAGGVPEMMWHLRQIGLLRGDALTITGQSWNQILDAWPAVRGSRPPCTTATGRC